MENNLFDDILPPESEVDEKMSTDDDPTNLEDPEEDMVDAVEYAKVKKNFLRKLIVRSVKLLAKVDKQKRKWRKSKDVNVFDVEKQLLGNLRVSEENKTKKMQCLLANEKSMQSYFWSARKSQNMDTKQIIEAEFPGCRKEIPECETWNVYGDSARAIEIAAYHEYGAIHRIKKSSLPKNTLIIDGRFVYAMKNKPVPSIEEMTGAHVDLNRKLDARLCARGFRETMTENVSAPTVDIATIRVALGIIPIKKWSFRVIDISRAYLQAHDLERTVILQPPKGTEPDDAIVWKCVKPIYGLCDSTKNWAIAMKDFLIKETGARQSIADPALFYWSGWKQHSFFQRELPQSFDAIRNNIDPINILGDHESKIVHGFCTVHVDDILMSGSDKFLNWLTEMINNRFWTKSFDENDASYLGMHITKRKDGSIVVDSKELRGTNQGGQDLPTKNERSQFYSYRGGRGELSS